MRVFLWFNFSPSYIRMNIDFNIIGNDVSLWDYHFKTFRQCSFLSKITFLKIGLTLNTNLFKWIKIIHNFIYILDNFFWFFFSTFQMKSTFLFYLYSAYFLLSSLLKNKVLGTFCKTEVFLILKIAKLEKISIHSG